LLDSIFAYDLGQFLFYVGGQANTTTIGRIYVEYDITFQIPDVASTEERGLMTSLRSIQSKFTGVDSTHWWGTGGDQSGGSINYGPLKLTNSLGSNTWTLEGVPVGVVLKIILRMSGTVFASVPVITMTTGSTNNGVGNKGDFSGIVGTTEAMVVQHNYTTSTTVVWAFSGTTFTTLVYTIIDIEYLDYSYLRLLA
jgi:hypothetical protein